MFIKTCPTKICFHLIILLTSLASLSHEQVVAQERAEQSSSQAVVRLKATLNIDGMEAIDFSPDNKLMAISRKDRTVQLWNVEDEKLQATLNGFKQSPSLNWSPDGLRLLTTNWGKGASVWNVQTGQRLYELNDAHRGIRDVKWSPDGKMILALDGKFARVWDAETGTSLYELSGLQHDISSVRWSPDRRTIMTLTVDDSWKADLLDKEKVEAQFWDAATGRLKFTLKIKGLCGNVKFSPDGNLILTTGDKEDPKLWDAATGELKATLNPIRRSIDTGGLGIFSPDGRTIATKSYGRGIYLWDAATGKLQVKVVEESFDKNDYVNSLRGFSPDGKLVV
ncbi:MAG TPA: hypothetical protein VKB86_03340, partial [Pyrinomonadaceae bacterium]|nr:hypothetical protein [Pyrinomonadaceae bacterium]